MVRRALAIYLVLVTAAGPSLCCCSLVRLIAAPAAQAEAPAELPPCCQHSPGGDRPHGHDGCPGDGEQKHRCPCREDASKPAHLDRAVDVTDPLLAGPSFFAPALAAAFGGYAGVAPASSWEPPPPLTAWGLLHLHHQLRC